MEIKEGKYYQNSKGLIRKVVQIGEKKTRWGSFLEVDYIPVSATGKEGTQKSCALSTIKGWAKREYDPEASKWVSPKRQTAADFLLVFTDSSPAATAQFVDLVVEAAKDEFRRELALDAG